MHLGTLGSKQPNLIPGGKDYGPDKGRIDLSATLKLWGISPAVFAERTGWDRRSIVHWCKTGVPKRLDNAVYCAFRFFNGLQYNRPDEKRKPYSKRRAPNALK